MKKEYLINLIQAHGYKVYERLSPKRVDLYKKASSFTPENNRLHFQGTFKNLLAAWRFVKANIPYYGS